MTALAWIGIACIAITIGLACLAWGFMNAIFRINGGLFGGYRND
jgi:hypothetical protein